MSEENVEIVRRYAEAFFARGNVEAALREVAPDAVFDWSESRAPYRGIRQGHAELGRVMRDARDAFDEVDPQFEITALDGERVLLVNTVRARGKASGATTRAVGATVWTLRDSKIVHAKLFQSKAEALEAAGLSE